MMYLAYFSIGFGLGCVWMLVVAIGADLIFGRMHRTPAKVPAGTHCDFCGDAPECVVCRRGCD